MNDFDLPLLPPALLSVPGVTPLLLQSLFAAAADFYSIQPWTILKGEKVIAVGLTQLAGDWMCLGGQSPPKHIQLSLEQRTSYVVQSPDLRLVVVMGAGGQAFGISVYDSPADLQLMFQLDDPLAAAGALCWLALTYETAEYLDRDDLKAIHQHGWAVAGIEAYPAIARIGTPGPDLQPPTLQDLLWLEGCLRALCLLFSSYLILDEQGDPLPVDLTLPVETSAGILEAHLHMPGMQV